MFLTQLSESEEVLAQDLDLDVAIADSIKWSKLCLLTVKTAKEEIDIPSIYSLIFNVIWILGRMVFKSAPSSHPSLADSPGPSAGSQQC